MKDYHKHNLDRVLNGATKKHLQSNNRISDTKSNLLKSTTNTENSSVTSNLQDNKDYDNNNKKNGINKSSLGADVANNKRLSAAERRKYYVMVVLLLIGLIIGLISLLSILMLPSFVSHQISKVGYLCHIIICYVQGFLQILVRINLMIQDPNSALIIAKTCTFQQLIMTRAFISSSNSIVLNAMNLFIEYRNWCSKIIQCYWRDGQNRIFQYTSEFGYSML